MKKKILVHICCGSCFIAPYFELKKKFDVYGFWFNHNIHPYSEYEKRLNTLKQFSVEQNINIIYKDEYNLEDFLRKAAYRETNRCHFCYFDRLNYAAIVARKGKFDYFTTTLLYSKFQKHELIREIAESVSKQHKIPFYYEDFRLLWKKGIELSKEKDMYRQQYCGCIYSERDRYQKKGEL